MDRRERLAKAVEEAERELDAARIGIDQRRHRDGYIVSYLRRSPGSGQPPCAART